MSVSHVIVQKEIDCLRFPVKSLLEFICL